MSSRPSSPQSGEQTFTTNANRPLANPKNTEAEVKNLPEGNVAKMIAGFETARAKSTSPTQTVKNPNRIKSKDNVQSQGGRS